MSDVEGLAEEHVIDRDGLVWRVVRDGGMATRAHYAGIVSIGIATLEREHGPLVTLAARVQAARAEGAREALEPVLAVLTDEPPLLGQIRRDMGEGFPNELSERRGRTITGWVDRLRAAALRADDAGGEGL